MERLPLRQITASLPKKLPKRPQTSNGAYFRDETPVSELILIPSGCTLLDQVLGGGYPLGRMVNIVGDKSTGKTLLAIEACANFIQTYRKARIHYAEGEAAFDRPYAASLGMPLDAVTFPEIATVEDLFEDLEKVIDSTPANVPGLYIVDSLDSLSDRAEQARKIDEGTFGAAKAKQLSQLFRRLVKKLGTKQILLIIISQIRDNIGVTFGNKFTRSGGHALDFYASQVLYLAHMGRIKKTVKTVERAVGVKIRAKCDKNKVGLPFRECEFKIRFEYGVDDVDANLTFLTDTKRLAAAGIEDNKINQFLRRMEALTASDHHDEAKRLATAVVKVWQEIENGFKPTRKKYA